MKRLLLSIFVFSFLSGNILLSQSTKQFKKLYIEAESYFLYGDYYNALPKYSELIKLEPLNSNINFAIGLCYLNIPGKADDAITYLERASTDVSKTYKEGSYKEKKAPEEAIFYLGKAYLLEGLLDKAIETFQKYRKLLDVSEIYFISYVDLQISQCKNAKELMQTPVIVEKEKLQNKINTEKSKEFNPIVTKNEELLFFSRYLQMVDKEVNEKYFITAIFQSYKKENGWSSPVNITRRIGSEDYCETSFISDDGKHLLVNRVELDDSYNIYESYQIGSKWSEVKRLHKYVNSHSNDKSAMLTNNGSTIYFVSDRPGGLGGKDIYKSTLNSKGNWDEPINLGSTINTEFDEETPYFLEENKTLYFSSEGHHSMGGLDVFYSKQQDNGTWSEPFNIGYPANTLADDLGYYPINEEYAYYATYTDDKYSDKDIYKIRILPNFEINEPLVNNSDTVEQIVENIEENKDSVLADNTTVADTTSTVEVTTSRVGTVVYGIKEISLNGKITLQDNKDNFDSFNVEIVNTSSHETIADIKPDENGKFTFVVNPGNYKLNFTGEGYHENSKIVNISTDYSRENAEINVEMIPVEVSKGEYFVIKSIFFEYNSAKLMRDAKIELEKLNKLMEKNPSLYLEVTGHTDSRGRSDYNLALSKKRARAVIDYLVAKNIEKERFVAKGVGEKDELAINQNPDGTDNPEGRKYNRRVDIKILRSNNDNIITQDIYVPEHLRLKKSLTFTILLSETTKKYEANYFEKFKDIFTNVWILPTDNGYAYSVGEFEKKSDAISLLNKVIDNGFPDARIINNIELKKIHESGTAEAIANKQKKNEMLKNGSFTIQLMALKNPVELSYFNNLENVKKYLGNDGYTRYTYGVYTGYKAAKNAINSVINKGYTDAFVVNTEKYK